MNSDAAPTSIPTARFVVSNPAHLIAIGFGSGLPAKAPGTWGTLFGWAVYLWIAPYLTPVQWAVILVAAFVVGCWACNRTGRDLGVPDHGAMVWDEIVAIWLVLVFTPWSVAWQLAAFAVFRFFDIVKPPPIQRFERRFKSGAWAGFGVMGDDLIAAFYSLVVLAVASRTIAWFGQAH
jgi:phosphatidylglycerophosphatase A